MSTEADAALRQQKHSLGIVVHREQFLGDRGSLEQSSDLQVRLQQIPQAFGMRSMSDAFSRFEIAFFGSSPSSAAFPRSSKT